MIQYECFCGYTKEVPDDWVGKEVKCPKCKNTGEVQQPQTQNDWDVTDNQIPSRMQGHWRPSPQSTYRPDPRPMTWTQGAWIIFLLALPFIVQLIALLIVLLAMAGVITIKAFR